ncbi:MAG: hypothetical protein Q8908_07750, partial [Bacteroidota bacterium]|nr:hypothetical protein [Bacteroidota bacterium]
NFVTLKKSGEFVPGFDEILNDFIVDVQSGNWLENHPLYIRFSKDLASLLVDLLKPCFKFQYTIDNGSDVDFKLKIRFENQQFQNHQVEIISNDFCKAKIWPERLETLLDPNNESINLCKWFGYLNSPRISECFWRIYVMQESNPYLLSFVHRLDFGVDHGYKGILKNSPTFNKNLSLDDFISKWCSETIIPALNNGELKEIEKNLFHEKIPVKDMRVYFSALTEEKSSSNHPFLSEAQFEAFIDKVCLGKSITTKIQIDFNVNKETSIIRRFFWDFYCHCVTHFGVSSNERIRFAKLLCDNFNNFALEITLTNFSKVGRKELPNKLKK